MQPTKLTVNYSPPGPVVEAFLESQAFVRGIRGPFGSGKSTACCFEVLRRALSQQPGPDGIRRTRWAVIRNTYPELKTTTIPTWHEIVPQKVGRWIDQGPPTHHIVGNGIDCEVLFLALDSPADVRKLLSMNLTGAWVNEAREVPKAVIDGITGRVGRFPSASMGGPTWFGVILDTNPPDTDHWWYTLAEKDATSPQGARLLESVRTAEEALRNAGHLAADQQLFEFFAQPSGLSPTAENRDVLPPGYYERLCAGKSEDWIKVYVRGEYGFAFDGQPIFPEYLDSLHCREFDAVRGAPLLLGADFGLTPAGVIVQRLANGAYRVLDEVVTQDMGAMRFGELFKRKVREQWPGFEIAHATGDPAGDQRIADDETKTVFSVLANVGLKMRPARTNDFTVRREAVASLLSKLVDGEPALVIHPRCVNLRKALAGKYCYRRLQVPGDVRYQSVPDKNAWSHVAEALQYALLGAGEDREVLRPRMRRTTELVVESDYSAL